MDLAAKTFKDVTEFDGMDSWPLWSQRRPHLLRLRPRRQGPDQHLARRRERRRRRAGDRLHGRRRPVPLDLRRRQDHRLRARLRHLQARPRHPAVKPSRSTSPPRPRRRLTEFSDYNSTVDDYDVAPDGKRIAFAVHGEIFTARPTKASFASSPKARPATGRRYSPDGKWIAFVSDQSGREEIYVVAADGAGPARRSHRPRRPEDVYRLVARLEDDRLHDLRRQALTIGADGKDLKELASSKYGPIGRPAWSPDGKWIAYRKPDVIAVEPTSI